MKTLNDTYRNLTHRLCFALANAQRYGVLIDQDVQQDLLKKYKAKVASTQDEISALVGRKFNPGSPVQVMKLLYDEMHFPIVYNKGKRTSNEDAILKLHKQYPDEPVLQLILTYRKDTKLIGTYLEIQIDEDGRIRTSYNASGTDTYRISSSKNLWGSGLQLQNIPKGKRPGVANIRHMFVAPKGFKLVKCDLVQAEAKYVAWLLTRYKDFTLYKKYKEPTFDIHNWGAAPIFGVTEDNVTKHMRDVGKIGNHAGNYCSGPRVVMSTAMKYGVDGIDYQMAKKIVNTRRKMIPGLVKWWAGVEMQIRKSRTLYTPMGRRRIFHGRFDDNATIRTAVAFEPQSSVGDVCNTIFTRLYEAISRTDATPILQVHDEVVAETPEDRVDTVKEEMRKAAMIPLYINPEIEPLIIDLDITSGDNWRDQS